MSTMVRASRTMAEPVSGPLAGSGSAPTTGRSVIVRWAISRAALHRARPDLVPSAEGPAVVLSWHIQPAEGGALTGGAMLADGARVVPLLSLVPSATPGAADAANIDLPGLLAVSFDGRGEVRRVRYAHTELLGFWDLPGGRYELIRDGERA